MTRAAALVLVGLLAGCAGSAGGTPNAPTERSVVTNPTVACPEQPDEPAGGGELLADLVFDCLGGGQVDLGRAQGLPTVINLWASWCGPCREELPVVQQLADAAGDRVRVLGLLSQDPAGNGVAFAADVGVTIATAVDADGELAIAEGLRGLPYTYFLRADGSVAHLQLRPIASLAELRRLVVEHLGVSL